LVLIQRARQTGFTLTETKQLFFGFRAGTPPSVRWQKLKRRKIVELDAMLEHIQNMRALVEQQGKCRCTAIGGMREEDVREAVLQRASERLVLWLIKEAAGNCASSK
jgi:DNA-binding transcriptional MerR regulator